MEILIISWLSFGAMLWWFCHIVFNAIMARMAKKAFRIIYQCKMCNGKEEVETEQDVDRFLEEHARCITVPENVLNILRCTPSSEPNARLANWMRIIVRCHDSELGEKFAEKFKMMDVVVDVEEIDD